MASLWLDSQLWNLNKKKMLFMNILTYTLPDCLIPLIAWSTHVCILSKTLNTCWFLETYFMLHLIINDLKRR